MELTAEHPGRQIYQLASLVEDCAENPGTFLEILPPIESSASREDNTIGAALFKPSKSSVLHYYICAMVTIWHRRQYRKNGDYYDNEEAERIITLAADYGITLRDFRCFCDDTAAIQEAAAEHQCDCDETFYLWYLSHEGEIETLWEYMTSEVFELLFANRRFLMTFNLSLAEYLEGAQSCVYPGEFTGLGRIPRAKNVPNWLKKAIYCRDHGRCVLCYRDLTGLLSTDHALQYDHMVPLKKFGTNDPVNFQLLCKSCNLSKGAEGPITSCRYPTWWS